MIAEQLTDPVAYHGEGAVWHAPWGGLTWVDMLAGDILQLDSAGAITRTATGSSIAAMVRPRVGGGMVVATRRRFQLWSEDGQRESTAPLWVDGERFNEGAIDPLGRVVCGTIHDSRETGSAALWRLELDGTARRILDGVTISNGLAFSPDGRSAFYVDSRTRRIDRFDVDELGELRQRHTFVEIGDDVAGNPDGLCLDAEGGVWVAFYNGGAARRYDASGDLDVVVEVPGVARVTSCALGGAALSDLFLTTSREGLRDDDEPSAGAIFTAEVGVPGIPIGEAAL